MFYIVDLGSTTGTYIKI